MHVRAALAAGDLSANDVSEIVLQQAIYCGVPAANAAYRVVGEVIAEINSTTRAR
jgi:alkylhydroperoxidase/carboxymuconolactone decarboxylase family protein YurZ